MFDRRRDIVAARRHRRSDDFPVGARRQLHAKLFQQRDLVHHEPAFDHLAVFDYQPGDFINVNATARRRNAEEGTGVRAGDAKQQTNAVAVGNYLLHHVDAVGKRIAQIHARMRPVLIARIARQMEIAAAHAIIVGGQHFLLDLRHCRRALRLFETQRDGDILGELPTAVWIGVFHLRLSWLTDFKAYSGLMPAIFTSRAMRS